MRPTSKTLFLVLSVLLWWGFHPHCLAKSSAYQQALDAYHSGLPEVAAIRLQECLAEMAPSDPDRSKIQSLLLECLVRSGQATSALEQVKSDSLELEQANFWKAMALAQSGDFAEAIDGFLDHLAQPTATYSAESTRNVASLMMAMGKLEDASKFLLNSPIQDADLNLLRAELFLREEKAELSIKTLDEIANKINPEMPLQDYLYVRIRALLKLGRNQEIIELLPRMNKPPIAGARLFLGARAKLNTGRGMEALDDLIQLIQDQPSSPLLPNAFALISQSKPINNNRLQEGLDRWIEAPELERRFQSLFLRAQLGHLNAAGKDSAQRDLEQLLTEAPNHYLSAPARLALALWKVSEIGPEQSRAELKAIASSALDPQIRLRARIHLAELLAEAENEEAALETMREASFDYSPELQSVAWFNEAILSLPKTASSAATSTLLSDELKQTLRFERALFASSSGRPDTQELDTLIRESPEHPLVRPARIALTTALLQQPSPPAQRVRQLVDQLKLEAQDTPISSPDDQLTRLEISLARVEGDWTRLIELIQHFLQTNSKLEDSAELRLQLGNAHFERKEFNEAQVIFATLAQDETQPASQRNHARFLAAKSGTLIGTPQSLEQAVDQLLTLAKGRSAFAEPARFEAARLLFRRLDQAQKALELLAPLTHSKNSSNRLRAIALSADIHGSRCPADPEAFPRAQKLLTQLLDSGGLDAAWRQRCLLRRAEIAERAGQTATALNDYFELIKGLPAKPEFAGTDPYFIRQAGKAIVRLLRDQGRIDAAEAIEKKLEQAGIKLTTLTTTP